MATLLNPILTGNPFESTHHRYNSLFRPIQKTPNKESDFLAFIATPLLDYFVLDTIFALDISIRLINIIVSLHKVAYLWTLNQQSTPDIIDKESLVEIREISKNLDYILSSVIAQFYNTILSTLSLITRPIASIAYELNYSESDKNTEFYSFNS